MSSKTTAIFVKLRSSAI